MSNIDEQFLPLDSSIKTDSVPHYSSHTGYQTDSICQEDSEVCQLSSKISELEKNYMEMEKKYLRKIKELKEQLIQKHQNQCMLTDQLSSLNREYDQHKEEIQKISAQIRKSLLENSEKQHKEPKLKSASPKNHTSNHSPKRLIKKSLEMAKNVVLPSKKQAPSKDVSSSQDIDLSRNTQRSDKKVTGMGELTVDYGKSISMEEESMRNSNENSLNTSNPPKNSRKLVYSPTGQTNGPSPKKKLLFNSSKELDLFSKPLQKKEPHVIGNGSPQRRINNSPIQKKKEQQALEGNKMVLEKELKKELAVIEEKPVRLEVRENESRKLINVPNQQPSSPAHRKKASSPETAVGLLRKKISNKNLTINTDFGEDLKSSKESDKQKQKQSKQQKLQKSQKTEKLQKFQQKQEAKLETEKKSAGNKSPRQTQKYLKMSPTAVNGTKFSPGRKLLRNSPTHKKTEAFSGNMISQKPKLFTNMREKFDDNIFK